MKHYWNFIVFQVISYLQMGMHPGFFMEWGFADHEAIYKSFWQNEDYCFMVTMKYWTLLHIKTS